ncbi:hypothetical protein [Altererythrobacter sp. MTPC7]
MRVAIAAADRVRSRLRQASLQIAY